MQPLIYFDVLDTARTALGGAEEELHRANECILLGQAELKMSVLRGWTPVFPQTYGWDSGALLSYFEEEDEYESASFGWLLEKGYIQIRLRNAETIWDAALNAFQNPAYRHLAAWPEFNTDDPLEARRPLVEAMRTGKNSTALPDPVSKRLESLRKLSAAVRSAPPADPELLRGDKLRTLIARTAEAAQEIDQTTARLLQQCTQLSDPNNRTAIYTFLDEQKSRGADVPPEVREIADCCLNAVMAQCLGAKRGALTTQQSQRTSSIQILLRAFPGSHETDLFQETIESPRSTDLSDLEVVGWRAIRQHLRDTDGLSVTEKARQAEAVKFIAKRNIEGSNRYLLRIEAKHFLLKGALSAAAAFAGFGLGLPVLCIAGLAGALSGLDLRSDLKRIEQGRLERKLRGLLQTL